MGPLVATKLLAPLLVTGYRERPRLSALLDPAHRLGLSHSTVKHRLAPRWDSD